MLIFYVYCILFSSQQRQSNSIYNYYSCKIVSNIVFVITIIFYFLPLFFSHPSVSDLSKKARKIAMDLRGNEDPSIKNLACVSDKHIQRKDTLFDTFLRYLSANPKLSELAERYEDPEDPGSFVSNFILMTRGPKSRVKFEIVNRALICFVQNHKRNKAVSGLTDTSPFAYEYQSTTWDTMLKTLFSYFGEHGVLYKHPTDFMTGRGTYAAVLDQKFAKISRERVDFGSLPNRSAIYMASFPKIVKAIKEGNLKPYDEYDDLILLVNFLLGVTFMLRGRKEHHTLTWRNFRFSKVASGKYAGRRKLELVSLQDKSCHVTVRNTVRRENTGFFDAVECIENPNTCVVHWLHHLRTLCPPEQPYF